MTSMRAVRLHGVPNDTHVDMIEAPVLTPDGVIVRLTAATICANDWKAAMKGSSRLELPTPLGHELAGVVEEVGDNISGYRPGDRVCIRFAGAIYCGHCYYCLRGMNNFCDNWLFFEQPAGWVEYMYFDARLEERLLPIADQVSFEAAALVEPLACALAGIDMADIQLGEDVVILGAGPMGLFNLQLALLAGAGRVFVIETVPSRAEIAERLGAAAVVDFKQQDPVKTVLELTGGSGAASVIECSGTLAGARQSIDMARKRGTVVWFAGFPKPAEIQIDPNRIHYGGINLTGTTGSTIRHAHKILGYLSAGRLDVEPIITHRFNLDRAREALEIAAEQGEALKIVLEP
ncbi:MAG: zinc-binding dehydrogenase [Anaerolineales bacterium]|nr:zinc-binding dehydrogenase [Anaerolineales bacterium]